MNVRQFVERAAPLCDAPWLGEVAAWIDGQMEADGGHDLGHLFRVLHSAMQIADDEAGCDRQVIAAACITHDLVNLPKNHPERTSASTLSADKAVEWFHAHFDTRQLELLHEAIRCHSFSSGLVPTSIEAKIVSDADNIDSLGAFGIARTFYVSGLLRRDIIDMVDPRAQTRPLDDSQYGLDHFENKLLKLRDRMYTAGGRRLADQRHEFVRSFRTQMLTEAGG